MRRLLPALILCCATIAAYWNTFSSPFVFDDSNAVQENSSIRHLSSPTQILSLHQNVGKHTGGRPLLNLSFALNYAVGGLGAQGYHYTNLVIHLLNGLLLYGICRRTLTLDSIPQALRADAVILSFFIALIWELHPLGTAAVSYIAQRAESLSATFYLATLYFFIRSFCAERKSRWYLFASVASCLIGLGCKETLGTAPIVVLLYDRCFLTGNFRSAIRSKPVYYVSTAGTWLVLLAMIVAVGGPRGDAHSLDTISTMWSYARSQPEGLIRYLQLGLWPNPLVFDYGPFTGYSLASAWPFFLAVFALLLLTVYALVRYPRLGFVGSWFFVIIAPSSTVIPLFTQIWGEHRMYLPLISEIVVLALLLHRFVSSILRYPILVAGAASLGLLTIERNRDYQSARGLWGDTLNKCPQNSRAHLSLGSIYEDEGLTSAAVSEYREGLRLDPLSHRAHAVLGRILTKTGALNEGLEHLHRAVQIKPGNAEMHRQLGDGLRRAGASNKALIEYCQALMLDPSDTYARAAMGTLYLLSNQYPRAIEELRTAVDQNPEYGDARCNLATALLYSNLVPEAVEQYRLVLEASPNDPDVHFLLGTALARIGNTGEAILHLKIASELNPKNEDVRAELSRLTGDANQSTTSNR
jgi:tetratricopeptide (TPR) repeat protein